MIKSLMRLSPLDDNYEQELLDKFGDLSRAVVLATLLSALVQGLLASVGYYFVGINGVFFLTALTMFMAMVPFLGAALVWLPVCAWIYLSQERPISAALLAVYCVMVVSMVDNVVKPWVLHGRSNLHPLLALLSVVGGVQALGPIGILVGPMLVSLFQALLVMLNKEIAMMGAKGEPILSGKEMALTMPQDQQLVNLEEENLPTPAALREPLPAKTDLPNKSNSTKKESQ
jgi:predicted PurR-regulated permease PerM